jgi:HD superfamily phosphohydrolase
MQGTQGIQGGQLGVFQNEILNWAANVKKEDLQWPNTAPDTDGQLKRNLFDYQRIKRLYVIAKESKPDSVLEALAHNQLIEAYAYWTKVPGYTQNGRQKFLDKVSNIMNANNSTVLFNVIKESTAVEMSNAVNQLKNELSTVQQQKEQEYQNTLQEIRNLKALRDAERITYEGYNEKLVNELNALRSMLITKDAEVQSLENRFQRELEQTQIVYKLETEKAVQEAKRAIDLYDQTSKEFNQARIVYEERTLELKTQFQERMSILTKEKDICMEKYNKLNELFKNMKNVLEKGLTYYQNIRDNKYVASTFFGYSSKPLNYEEIAEQIFQYMVQVASLIGQYTRIFGN